MPSTVDSTFRRLQFVSASLYSLGHGGNDAKKTMGIIAVLPNFFLGITGSGQNQNFPFGGTAVLIMVGVGLDTVKQIESQLQQRNYEGFLR